MANALKLSLTERLHRAHAEWGANCGPGALAAIMDMDIEEVRPHLGDFEAKRYMNPTMMFAALDSIGRPWRVAGACWPRYNLGADWPSYGLARIQWEGPWTEPGVPIRARYRHTHWVAAQHGRTSGDIGVFDTNAVANGTGWVSLPDWEKHVVPFLLEEFVPRASGGWHITHSILVDRPPAMPATIEGDV